MKRRLISLLSLGLVALGCQGDKSIQLGAVLPLSGSAQVYGQSVKRGIDVAMASLGAEKSTPVVHMTIQDSQSDPAKARDELEAFFRAGAMAAIGGVTTAEAIVMVPVADEFDRILLSPTASSPELTGISANFYRVFASDFIEGTKMGNFSAQTLQLEKVVILAAEGPYAVGVQQVFKAEFERNGGQVMEIIEFPENPSDFSGLLDRVMTLKPDAVYLAAFGADIAAMVRGLRERSYRGSILTTSAFASAEAIASAGEAAKGVFLTQTAFDLDSEEPAVKKFVDAYRAKFKADPDIYSAHGYDSVMVLAEALKQDVHSASDVWKGLHSLRNFMGATGTIQFDDKGDVQKFPRVYVIDSESKLINYEGEVDRRRRELMQRLRALDDERRKAAATANEGR